MQAVTIEIGSLNTCYTHYSTRTTVLKATFSTKRDFNLSKMYRHFNVLYLSNDVTRVGVG